MLLADLLSILLNCCFIHICILSWSFGHISFDILPCITNGPAASNTNRFSIWAPCAILQLILSLIKLHFIHEKILSTLINISFSLNLLLFWIIRRLRRTHLIVNVWRTWCWILWMMTHHPLLHQVWELVCHCHTVETVDITSMSDNIVWICKSFILRLVLLKFLYLLLLFFYLILMLLHLLLLLSDLILQNLLALNELMFDLFLGFLIQILFYFVVLNEIYICLW